MTDVMGDPIIVGDPNMKRGRFVYTDDDIQAVVELVTEQGINYVPEDVRDLLRMRTGRDITLSGAKNLLTRLRGQGLVPNKTPDRNNTGGKKKAKMASKPAPKKPNPKGYTSIKAVKKFDPGMTGDDLFDFNVQCIYAAQDNMPVGHVAHLMKFHRACQELMEALTK